MHAILSLEHHSTFGAVHGFGERTWESSLLSVCIAYFTVNIKSCLYTTEAVFWSKCDHSFSQSLYLLQLSRKKTSRTPKVSFSTHLRWSRSLPALKDRPPCYPFVTGFFWGLVSLSFCLDGLLTDHPVAFCLNDCLYAIWSGSIFPSKWTLSCFPGYLLCSNQWDRSRSWINFLIKFIERRGVPLLWIYISELFKKG